ncbi:PASTA domain-containing protein [Nonomuraea muscovyensis]|uniref:PASTA domain-containing protein n=1 Tax=Nonomuraea muscovyensis TaxID=1124761 RepID=UPI0033DA2466
MTEIVALAHCYETITSTVALRREDGHDRRVMSDHARERRMVGIRPLVLGLLTVPVFGLAACSGGGEDGASTEASRGSGAGSQRPSPALPSFKGKTYDAVSGELRRSWPAYTTAYRALPDGHLFDGESYSGTWIVCTQVEDSQARKVEFGFLPPQVPCPPDGRVTTWPVVPNFVGTTGNEAKQAALQFGFPLVSSQPLVTEGYDDSSHLERTVCTQDPPAGQSMRLHYGTTLDLRVADSKGSCTP